MTSPNLSNVRIASPCSASWDAMEGDGRRRFCGDCSLHVYNLSGMEEAEAVELLESYEGGRLCVRLFRHADGTVITQNCPKGLARVKRRMARVAVLAAGLLGAGAAGAAGMLGGDPTSCPSTVTEASWVERIAPLKWARDAFGGHDTELMGRMEVMGDVAFDPIPAIPTTTP